MYIRYGSCKVYLAVHLLMCLNISNDTHGEEVKTTTGSDAPAKCNDSILKEEFKKTDNGENIRVFSNPVVSLSPPINEKKDIKEKDGSSKNVNTNTVFFNRVPKAGSATLLEILRHLSIKNGFTMSRDGVFHESQREDIMLDYEQQIALTTMVNHFSSPTVYFQHTGFVDFKGFNSPMPIYINMVRDPIERVISAYYYKRSAPVVVRKKTLHPNSKLPSQQFLLQRFEDCVNKHNPECVFIEGFRRFDMNQLTEFFCGQESYCSGFNTDEALRKAKDNVEKHYAVVGVLEDFNKTLQVFEHYIPKIFMGSFNVYWNQLHGENKHKNIYKPTVDSGIRNVLERNFTREIEFYEFCKQRLHRQYMHMPGRHATK